MPPHPHHHYHHHYRRRQPVPWPLREELCQPAHARRALKGTGSTKRWSTCRCPASSRSGRSTPGHRIGPTWQSTGEESVSFRDSRWSGGWKWKAYTAAASVAATGVAAASVATAGVAAIAAAGRAADGDAGGAAGEVALGGDDLVVVGAELEAGSGPGVEVGGHVDAATGTLVLADRPVLVEGRGALDRRLVDTLGTVDIVGRAVGGDAAELGGARRGVVRAEVLNDVVLDQGVLGPAVDGKVRVAVRAVGTAVGDGAREGAKC